MMTVFAFFCSGALAAERDSISVNGHASAEVAPDMATLYGNLEKRAAVAETARENLAKDMAAFKHVLLGQAIPGEDIQTVRYSLQPQAYRLRCPGRLQSENQKSGKTERGHR